MLPHTAKKMMMMGGGFSPKDIAGLTVWMLADDLAGADGDTIASWVSREGNSYNFAQGTAAKKPLLKKASNGINGHNVVLFDGADDILVLGSNIISDTSGTAFVVYKLSAGPSNSQCLFGSCDVLTTATNVCCLFGYTSAATLSPGIYQNNNDGADYTKGYIAPGTNPTLVCYKSTGSIYYIRENGLYDTLNQQSGANNGDWFGDTTARDNFTIGGAKFDSEGWFTKGNIAEILYYNSSLTLAQIEQVEGYLASKYGITISPSLKYLNIPIQSMDVDTLGNIYAANAAVVKKSTDGGDTWATVLTHPGGPTIMIRVFCDSRNYIYVSAFDGTDTDLYQSTDGGANFAAVLDPGANACIWGIDEDSAGNLYAGEYTSPAGAGQARIWKSADDGATWNVVYTGDTGAGNDQIHDVHVDPLTDWIYASVDPVAANKNVVRSKDAGATWNIIFDTSLIGGWTAIPIVTPGDGYIYLGLDNATLGVAGIWRFVDAGGATVPNPVIFYASLAGHLSYVYGGNSYGGKMIFGTYGALAAQAKNILLWNGSAMSEVEETPALSSLGYYSVSPNNYGGKLYIARGTTVWTNGVVLDMTKV